MVVDDGVPRVGHMTGGYIPNAGASRASDVRAALGRLPDKREPKRGTTVMLSVFGYGNAVGEQWEMQVKEGYKRRGGVHSSDAFHASKIQIRLAWLSNIRIPSMWFTRDASMFR